MLAFSKRSLLPLGASHEQEPHDQEEAQDRVDAGGETLEETGDIAMPV